MIPAREPKTLPLARSHSGADIVYRKLSVMRIFPQCIHRWLIFGISCALFILSHYYRAAIAVISPHLMLDLGLDAQELSLVSAAFFYAFAVMQIPVGLYLDSIGPRAAMTALSLVSTLGALIFAWGNSVMWLTAGRALLGIGMACNFMGALKLLTLWFGPRQFATLSAVVVSVGSAGSIAAATPQVLLVQALGWRSTFVIMAAATFLVTLLFFLIVRDRPDAATGGDRPNTRAPEVQETLRIARVLFRQKDFWIISLGTFCRYGVYAAVQALWAGPYLIQVIGLSPVTAGNIIFAMNMGLIIGSPLIGWISDMVIVSRKVVIIGGLLGMAAILAAMTPLPPGTGAPLLFLLFFSFGLFSSTGQVMYAHIKEQVDLRHAGLAMTGINFFTMAGVAVFLQGMGKLMTLWFPEDALGAQAFELTFLFCAGALLFLGGIYGFTRETLEKRRD